MGYWQVSCVVCLGLVFIDNNRVGVLEWVFIVIVQLLFLNKCYCGGVFLQGFNDNIWLSFMVLEGCQYCWLIWSINVCVFFVNVVWLVKCLVFCVENVGKLGEVYDEVIVILGISVRVKVVSFIMLFFVGNIYQFVWFLGE